MNTHAELPAKPVPDVTPESAPYWEGLRQHKLLLQACADCGQIRHYPRAVCATCYSIAVTWIEANGAGTIQSWTVAHHPFHPGFKIEVPYALLLVDLAEGVRVNAPLRGDPAGLQLGRAVRLIFENGGQGFVLPAFEYSAE